MRIALQSRTGHTNEAAASAFTATAVLGKQGARSGVENINIQATH